jgi:ABC-type branched-subunit amino acid transport system substrate-binding protein
MTTSRHRRGIALAGSVAVAALLAAGCGNNGGGGGSSSSPGITDKTVKIGGHTPLTGPAAPGYSEIAPAAKAFFAYINAQGGINGRKIQYIYKDDGYNPTKTVSVVRELVLQDKVFAIFNGLGTPTHTKVVDYLNTSKVPDLFVASGCPCWDDAKSHPFTFGWQTSYQIEGKVLGDYIKKHFAGKKVGVFYQDDDFGQGGLDGLKEELGDQIVAAKPYQPGNTDVAPQITAIQKAKADILVDFTIPAYTALGQLVSFKVGFKPQLFISSVGADPTTVGGLLKSFSKGKADTALIEGAYTDGYLPSVSDTSNPWIALFKKIHDQYDAKAPFDGNVEYGMAAAYTFAAALKAAGDDPTRQDIVDALNEGKVAPGPGLVPFRYADDDHGGFAGAQMGRLTNGKIRLIGTPMTAEPTGGPISPYDKPQETPSDTGVVKP